MGTKLAVMHVNNICLLKPWRKTYSDAYKHVTIYPYTHVCCDVVS